MDDFLSNRPRIDLGTPPSPGIRAPSAPAQPTGKVLPGLKGQTQQTVCEAQGARPKVETVSEDGVITRVIITCSDGQRIELRCQYDR